MNEPERDMRRLWNEQPREELAMSHDDIRSKAEQFERKVRRWNGFTPLLLIVLIGVEAWQAWRADTSMERAGDLLTIAALVYFVIRFREYAAIYSRPAALGQTSGVDFYRRLLTTQRDVASEPWSYLLLFVPGVALSLLGHAFERSIAQTAMAAAAGVALFLAVAWWHRHTARALQREIDQLR
jgi:hypothetical protein